MVWGFRTKHYRRETSHENENIVKAREKNYGYYFGLKYFALRNHVHNFSYFVSDLFIRGNICMVLVWTSLGEKKEQT